MLHRCIRRLNSENLAQDLIEYTLLLAFVALGAIGLLSQTGTSLSGLWGSANSTIAAGTPSTAGPAPAGSTTGGHGDGGGGDGH